MGSEKRGSWGEGSFKVMVMMIMMVTMTKMMAREMMMMMKKRLIFPSNSEVG